MNRTDGGIDPGDPVRVTLLLKSRGANALAHENFINPLIQ